MFLDKQTEKFLKHLFAGHDVPYQTLKEKYHSQWSCVSSRHMWTAIQE